MNEIINSTYKIIGRLGSGGGGVVYLAEHQRLGKKVVLKADKRNVSTKPELLRREVDVLKELSNPYIPVVYDYFIEDDTSYTVMDYVDGQSLDKLIKTRGQFTSPEVIYWARQLLCALSYLHSPTHGDPPRGYIHSDIKPANIMLRPSGDICLIDFNIALAIGVENVVGKSEGYSSPEHYGLDYSFGSGSDATVHQSDGREESAGDRTELDGTRSTDDKTEVDSVGISVNSVSSEGSCSSSFKKLVIPDARSDIYSVGATMYHLLGGKRPARDAMEVIPLSEKEYPALLIRIITRAMEPNPDLRYSSADEMLADIEGLWKDDPRVKRQKRRLIAGICGFTLLIAAGAGAVFIGTKQTERIKEGQVLASRAEDALSAGDVKTAAFLALQALPEDPGIFDIPYTSSAELALTNALGVYELSDDFKASGIVTLPSAPFRMALSPNGRLLAAGYAYEISIYDIASGQAVRTLHTLNSALCEFEFIDNDRIIYSGDEGLTAYDIAKGKALWTVRKSTAMALSEDMSVAAAVYLDESTVTFYDVSTGDIIGERSFGDMHFKLPENDRFADAMRDIFELNGDGSMLAASLTGGYLGIFDMDTPENDLVILEKSDYTKFSGGFAGDIFAFVADSSSGSLFGMADCDGCEFLGTMDGDDPFALKIYKDEIYITQNDRTVHMNKETFEQSPVAYTENKNITAFDISDNYVLSAYEGGWSVFCDGAGVLQSEVCEEMPAFVLLTDDTAVIADRDSPVIELYARGKNKYPRAEDIMKYDPLIDHSEARLHGSGSVMLFDINGFTILDPDGSVRISKVLPDPDKIYDQQYRRGDSEYLEVTYYSGKQVCYSAENGEIISEKDIPTPDRELGEEFDLTGYTVKAPLHGTPEVISKETGERVAELSEEDYLTYVTQFGDKFVLQYISAGDGEFYGVLMNEDWETVAMLPYLCDVKGDTLVFDLPGGSIKSSPVYGLSELRDMAGSLGN